MAADTTVDILLATYNGQAWLDELLGSLRRQTCTAWRLLARDDGSTDATVDLLDRFAVAEPGRVRVIRDEDRGLGPAANFGRLLGHSTARYVMFCDQDDLWLPDKIALTLEAIKAMEQRLGPDTPLLVHSAARVVDEGLAPVAYSFHEYQKLTPLRGRSLRQVMMQNSVVGCTTMINAALRGEARPLPAEVVMHDWWLAMVAAGLGEVGFVEEATVLYRQHGGNQLGATRFGRRYVVQQALARGRAARIRESLRRTQTQARAFVERFGGDQRLDSGDRAAVAAYADLANRGWLARRRTLVRHGLYKMGLARNVGLFVYA